ncbi:MAG: EF-hand domain-containing protein [Sphingomonas sp.]|nr:EF-hand domain-containing protein [Sphingomonas sp.]
MTRYFALALLAATPALAQDRPPPPSPAGAPAPPGQAQAPIPLMIAEPVAMAIAAFDADGDAVVTRAEFDAGVRRSFESVAKGQPSIGYIAFGDWADRWLGNRNALPSPFEVDSDGDNRITLAELQARFDLFFTRFDGDKDGRIVRSELLTLRPAQPPAGRTGDEGERRKGRRR